MAVDQEKVREHIRGILEAIGEDPDREGLRETPDRVARMYSEIFEGISYTNDEIANMFNKTFDAPTNNDMVLVRDIEIFSYCEHHMALMYDMKVNVAYIPRERVIGLSKIARIADMVGKRLQLQEKIGFDIAEIMEKATLSPDVAVIISGKHSCMTTRGIKNTPSVTLTTTFRGAFEKNKDLQDRVLRLIDLRISRDDI
jgi:GTP cyclohydrolase I